MSLVLVVSTLNMEEISLPVHSQKFPGLLVEFSLIHSFSFFYFAALIEKSFPPSSDRFPLAVDAVPCNWPLESPSVVFNGHIFIDDRNDHLISSLTTAGRCQNSVPSWNLDTYCLQN